LVLDLLDVRLVATGDISHRGLKLSAHAGDERRGELDGLVVLNDFVLHPFVVAVRRIAGLLLPAPAEEVEVLPTVTEAALDDHAIHRTRLNVVAASTEHAAHEVVPIHSAPFSGHATRLQQDLNPIEQVRIHDRWVSALVLHALVGDVAQVVARIRRGTSGTPALGQRRTIRSAKVGIPDKRTHGS
jgi:hypothetical protein